MRIFLALIVTIVLCLLAVFSVGVVAEFIRSYMTYFFEDDLLSTLLSYSFGCLLVAMLCKQIMGDD